MSGKLGFFLKVGFFKASKLLQITSLLGMSPSTELVPAGQPDSPYLQTCFSAH